MSHYSAQDLRTLSEAMSATNTDDLGKLISLAKEPDWLRDEDDKASADNLFASIRLSLQHLELHPHVRNYQNSLLKSVEYSLKQNSRSA